MVFNLLALPFSLLRGQTPGSGVLSLTCATCGDAHTPHAGIQTEPARDSPAVSDHDDRASTSHSTLLSYLCLATAQVRFNVVGNALRPSLQFFKDESMRIQHLEIATFPKLKSARIDLAAETTLLVGANNSGKSSAMLALRKFLVKPTTFRLQDLTLCHIATLDAIGREWEQAGEDFAIPDANSWAAWLPTLDVWIQAAQGELHHIRDLIPNFSWPGGMVGMRFRLEPEDLPTLYTDYRKERTRVATLLQEIRNQAEQGQVRPSLQLWPQSLHDYLNRRLIKSFKVRWYRLNPDRLSPPCAESRTATLQALADTAVPLERNPLLNRIGFMRSMLIAVSATAPMRGKTRAKREVAGNCLSSCARTIVATLIQATARMYRILKR